MWHFLLHSEGVPSRSLAEIRKLSKEQKYHVLCLVFVYLPYLCHYHDDHGEQYQE